MGTHKKLLQLNQKWKCSYLHCDVQRINNLPDHEGQDVDAKQNANSRIEFPWFQVLLGKRVVVITKAGWWGIRKTHKSSLFDFVREGFMKP